MAAILFLPFEIWTFLSGIQMVASLDSFIKKSPKNILFLPKRSRLVKKISGPGFECIQNPDENSVRFVAIQNPDSPVFGC
jgi:hypothetical protein